MKSSQTEAGFDKMAGGIYGGVDTVTRSALLSRMLSNRGVTRMLVAPGGFGKTTLARQYASKAFDGFGVIWIDGASPTFLCSIDAGTFPLMPEPYEMAMRLVIVDDLPALDVERARRFSEAIDSLLESGCEAIVIATPANDCLRQHQPDCIRIEPRDFVLGIGECRHGARLSKMLISDGSALGDIAQHNRIASLVWGDPCKGADECLRSFFSEGLPDEIMLPAYAMALIGEGTLDDLDELGIALSPAACEVLEGGYPYFGINQVSGTFCSAPFPLETVAAYARFVPKGWTQPHGIIEGIAEKLLERGVAGRAAELAHHLLVPRAKEAWAVHHAWEVLDGGGCRQLDALLESIPPERDKAEPRLMARRLWAKVMSGDADALLNMEAQRHVLEGVPEEDRLAFLLLGIDVGAASGATGDVAADLATQAAYPRGSRSIVDAIREQASGCSLECLSLLEGCPSGHGKDLLDASDGANPCPKNVGCRLDECLARQLCARAMLAACEGWTGAQVQSEGYSALRNVADLLEKAVMLDLLPAWRIALCMLKQAIKMCLSTPQEDLRIQSEALAGLATVCVPKGRRPITTSLLLFGALKPLHMSNKRIATLSDPVLVDAVCTMGSTVFYEIGMASKRPVSCLAAPLEKFAELALRMDESAKESEVDARNAAMGLELRALHDGSYLPEKAFSICEPDVPMLYVRMFGGFEMYVGGTPVSNTSAHKRQVKELMAYLLLHKGREVSRDAILAEMWPAFDCDKARNSFYVIWSAMRRAFMDGDRELPYIERGESTCHVNRLYVGADIFVFEDLVSKLLRIDADSIEMIETSHKMENLYRGDLLAGDFTSGFFETRRQLYRDMFVDAMVRASSRVAYDGNGFSAKWFARKALEFGEYREDVCQALIRGLLISGQRAAAIQIFRIMSRKILREYGIKPSAKTLKMLQEGIAGLEIYGPSSHLDAGPQQAPPSRQ